MKEDDIESKNVRLLVNGDLILVHTSKSRPSRRLPDKDYNNIQDKKQKNSKRKGLAVDRTRGLAQTMFRVFPKRESYH